MDKVRVLLDFDGVINALAKSGNKIIYDDWRKTSLTIPSEFGMGRTYPILYAQMVVDFVHELARDERVEVRWLTTWCEHTNLFPAGLGLPLLKWLGIGSDSPAISDRSKWWKFEIVQQIDPQQPLVWVDDDLDEEPHALSWAKSRENTLALCPRPDLGITPQMMLEIRRFIEDHS